MKVLSNEDDVRGMLLALMAGRWECDRIETDKRISPGVPDLVYSMCDEFGDARGFVELKHIDARLPNRSYRSGLTRDQYAFLHRHGGNADHAYVVIGVAPYTLLGFGTPGLLRGLMEPHKVPWYTGNGVHLNSTDAAVRFFMGRLL